MEYSVVIVAAGQGSRMGLGYNKVYAPLKDQRSILEHTMQVFLGDEECTQIVVVTDPEMYREMIHIPDSGRITVVQGGDSRQHSVRNGLCAVVNDVVMIHDGARPFLPMSCIEDLKKAMVEEKAACLMVPCKDTIKRVENGYIVETIERSTLRAAQTPQVFQTDLLYTCILKSEEDGYSGTDDCSLVEKYSDVKVKVVEGSYDNFKVTTPEDLR